MKYFAFIPLVLLVSCASQPQLTVRPVPAPAVEPVDSVRYGEVVRAYHLGRTVDPDHPGIMQEAHPVYRLEVSGCWNLHPGSGNAANLLNPPPDAAFAPPLTNDVLIEEMNRQRETTALVMQQAERLADSFHELQTMFTEIKQVARDNAVLGARLASTEKQVTGIEKELQKLAAPPAPSTNDIPAVSPKESPDPFQP